MIKAFKNWMIKRYGKCVFGHVSPGVYAAEMSNCIYKCEECGETWSAY